MKHILVISQYFYPEQFRINDMCEEWVKRGYTVTVVTGIPNYPAGKFFKGYGLFQKRKEIYKGIRIVRLPLIPRGKNVFMLLLNYLSFVVSGFFWGMFSGIKADYVFVFEVSPMTQALPAVWYAKKKKIPCYLYVQDLWPENVEIVMNIKSKFIIRPIDRMVRYIYKRCDQIFATSPSFVNAIKKKTENKEKIKYWPQYAETFYTPCAEESIEGIEFDRGINVIFTGNIGYAQGLEVLPQAAKLLKEKAIDCCFHIMGDGRYKKELLKNIEELEVQDMFHMIERKLPTEVPQYLAASDFGFLSFSPNELFEMTIPAKLQSYLSCGTPILGAVSGESARIIREADAGVVCGNNAEAIAEAIQKMQRIQKEDLLVMKENAIAYSKTHFSKNKLMDEMDLYFG